MEMIDCLSVSHGRGRVLGSLLLTHKAFYGKKEISNVIIAGSDRVAVDAVGVAILKFYKAEGIADINVKNQEQLKRAAEIGLGHLDADMIALKASNLAGDNEFEDLVEFVKRQL